MFTGIKDVDREILNKLDDKELLKACSIDKYTWNNVCDDDYLKVRLLLKYPEIGKYKTTNETWKQFFLKSIHYIALLKEKYNYEYEFGNFEKQYKIVEDFYYFNDLLYFSALEGELALVIWSIKNGADIYEEALILACENNHLDVVKYLLKIPDIDINIEDGKPLKTASGNGNFEIVKYLVENGADINIGDPLYLAILTYLGNSGEKELHIIKYLLEKGVNITPSSLSLAGYNKEIKNLLEKK